MNKNWPSKEKDMYIAKCIMEEFAQKHDQDKLGLFELVVNQTEKKMNFKMASWVVILAKHFCNIYGKQKGDFITRQVISQCITQDQTVH